MGLLVRSWNLFHGRTYPPGRHAYLEEMVRLVTQDHPDVVCLQEAPVWALRHLETWSGMTAVVDVACPASLPAGVAKWITDLNQAFFRGAFTGQADAVLVAPQLRVLEHARLVLNPRPVVGGLPRLPFLAERRICQVVRIELPDKRTLLVGNVHAGNREGAEAEVLRAAAFLEAVAREGEPVVLAGDFNLSAGDSNALAQLISPEWGFSAPGEGIDHILVRGLPAEALEVWPIERRSQNGHVLSDHAPVELRVG